MSDHPCAAVAKRIMAAKNVLLMTHLRPDGDALGSTFGMRDFLRSQGIAADVLTPSPLPRRYAQMCAGHLTAIEDLNKYDLFLALDCANAERLGCGENFRAADFTGKNFVCIDHHGGNSLPADISWISAGCGATCQMVMEMVAFLQKPLPPSAATFLLTGMMTDTGCFCFSNTSGNTLRAAAAAVDYGADVEAIANTVFFSKPLKQLAFEADLIASQLRIVCNGRVSYACVPDELLEKHDFDLREDEGLIDILRGLEGVVIAMLVHRRPDGWRISMRSKDSAYPVVNIARKFNGGGHALAAGCTIDVPDFAEIEKLLIPEFEALLGL